MIKSQRSFSKSVCQVLEPVIAMKRTIKIRAKEKADVIFLVSVSNNKEEALNNLESLKSNEEISRILNIAKARVEEESKYLRTDGDKILLYVKLLKYILKLNNIKTSLKFYNAEVNSLWRYGISGDNPIILVKIKNIEDIYVIEEIISAYEYYRAKRINIDLVIINNEIDIYERFVKQSIDELISDKQLDYLKNINAGIFIFNKGEILKEDYDVICFKSNLIIDASVGGIEEHIKVIEKEEKSVIINREINTNSNSEIYPLKKEKLMFDNSYGGFSLDGKEYLINKNIDTKLPSVWCNILANNFFGTIVSDSLGGYTWSKNSRLNRLTAWSNDYITDYPSEIFYIKDDNNKLMWTLNSNVVPNKNYYYITHGFGYSIIKNTNNNLKLEVEIFVPNEESLKFYKIRMKNLINEDRRIKIVIYIKPVLGEDEILTNGNIEVKKENNVLIIKNAFRDSSFKNRLMFITSNQMINSFTGEKDSFFGEGNILNPDALYTDLNNLSGLGKNSCIGIQFNLKFEKFEDKKINIMLGEVQNIEEIDKIKEKYGKDENIENEINNVKTKWKDIVNTITVKTPSESTNIMMNGWLIPYVLQLITQP